MSKIKDSIVGFTLESDNKILLETIKNIIEMDELSNKECFRKILHKSNNKVESLIKITPIIFYCYYRNLNEKEIIDIIDLTDDDEAYRLGLYIYIRYVLMILMGIDKNKAYDYLKKIDYSIYSIDSIKLYDNILNNDLKKLVINDKLEYSIINLIEYILFVILETEDFNSSINKSKEFNDISSLVGSITGIIYEVSITNNIDNSIIKLSEELESKLYLLDKNIIIGCAIGDIVGSRFELNNCKDKNFEFMPSKKCRITDDTVMTLAVAKALLLCNGDYSNLDSLARNTMVEIGRKYRQCGFGPTFYKWITTDNHEPYNSYGNGAAMRVSACGMIAKSEEEVKEITYKVTGVSHNHPDGIKGAEAVAMMIYLIINGYTKEQLKERFIKDYYPLNFNLKELQDTYKFDISCEGTVPQAFLCFLEAEDFEDSIRNAISIGGDSDTIGAITGSMAAAYFGIPKLYIEHGLTFVDEYLLNIITDFNKKSRK